ncbi:MAG: plasmid mobilization relaxosome protein MobC [Clostridia bacterium]|nr:plasmid mobilization relaxosome protein MobC [Clostridia bacterium]
MIEITENRRRNETLSIRLTKAEKSAIITKAKKARMNLTEYILAISKDTKITLPPDTAPIVLELKRIGNNLNQIAAKVNSGITYVDSLTQVIENQNKIYDLLLKLTEECKWQR